MSLLVSTPTSIGQRAPACFPGGPVAGDEGELIDSRQIAGGSAQAHGPIVRLGFARAGLAVRISTLAIAAPPSVPAIFICDPSNCFQIGAGQVLTATGHSS